MRRRARPNPQSDSHGRLRRGRITPIGGTTLLVLVTLVLATGQRETLPIRQTLEELRWAAPANGRPTCDVESRPTAPTKPSTAKFAGFGPLHLLPAHGLLPKLVCSTIPADKAIAAQRLVRVALLSLPPPRA